MTPSSKHVPGNDASDRLLLAVLRAVGGKITVSNGDSIWLENEMIEMIHNPVNDTYTYRLVTVDPKTGEVVSD